MRLVVTALLMLLAPPTIEAALGGELALSDCAPSREIATRIAACTSVIANTRDRRVLERATNTRGLAYLGIGDFDLAVADFTSVIRINPEVAGYFDNRQNAYRGLKDFGKALIDADEAVRLAPAYSFSYGARAHLHVAMGDLDSALRDYDKTLALSPDDAGGYADRGTVYRLKDQADKALSDFSHALSLNATLEVALRERGLTYKAIGKLELARADLKAAMQLKPQDADVSTALAQIDAVPSVNPATRENQQVNAVSSGPSKASLSHEKRIALVIGNSSYQNAPFLPNPRSDVVSVAEALRSVGFTTKVKIDLSRETFEEALADFAAESDQADWSLLYYAGHGMEIAGTNYLIPVDAKLETSRSVGFEAVPLTQAMEAVAGAHKLRLVILDACRANPFASRMQLTIASRSVERGLARPPEADPGMLVVYAARDGEVASDGVDGSGSPFSKAFTSEVLKQGTEIRRLFDLVSDDVIEETGDHQHPLSYGRLPGREDFYFTPKP